MFGVFRCSHGTNTGTHRPDINARIISMTPFWEPTDLLSITILFVVFCFLGCVSLLDAHDQAHSVAPTLKISIFLLIRARRCLSIFLPHLSSVKQRKQFHFHMFSIHPFICLFLHPPLSALIPGNQSAVDNLLNSIDRHHLVSRARYLGGKADQWLWMGTTQIADWLLGHALQSYHLSSFAVQLFVVMLLSDADPRWPTLLHTHSLCKGHCTHVAHLGSD